MMDAYRDLIEALEAMHRSYLQELEDARATAGSLLGLGRSARGSSPVAHTQWRNRLVEWSTTASVLRQTVEDLEEILGAHVWDSTADDVPGATTAYLAPPAPGDEGAGTSTREPGSEGRTRPESGQRKSSETPF